jgi:hypothetical protein
MRNRLSKSGLLAAWEIGAARRPLDRALTILWAAGDGDAADLPLAERDRRLLTIRAETFGASISVLANCPDCGAELEMDLDARGLADALPSEASTSDLRALTSRDLAAVSALEPEDVALTLRERLCGRPMGRPGTQELDARIEAQATSAELTTRITCADCGNVWSEDFDVAAHIWVDVENAALGLLSEVSEIAAVYGWSERDILALSPSRRKVYLARARQS